MKDLATYISEEFVCEGVDTKWKRYINKIKGNSSYTLQKVDVEKGRIAKGEINKVKVYCLAETETYHINLIYEVLYGSISIEYRNISGRREYDIITGYTTPQGNGHKSKNPDEDWEKFAEVAKRYAAWLSAETYPADMANDFMGDSKSTPYGLDGILYNLQRDRGANKTEKELQALAVQTYKRNHGIYY